MTPHPMTSVMQLTVTATALSVAAAAIAFVVWTASVDRNARLVEIGIAVLRSDPKNEGHLSAARAWALDLIDSNAGGVKFSKQARDELLQRPLAWGESYSFDGRGISAQGECRLFQPSEFVVEGKTREDQYWIDRTIETGVAGCQWPRPKRRDAK